MSIASTLSAVFVLIICQVNSDVVEVAKVTSPSSTDVEKLLQKGVIISHGAVTDESNKRESSLGSSGFVCLESGQSLKLTPSEDKPEDFNIVLNISYDFVALDGHKPIRDETNFKGKSRVCFFFGSYIRFSSGDQDKAEFFINLLTDKTAIDQKNVLSFYINLQKDLFDFSLQKLIGVEKVIGGLATIESRRRYLAMETYSKDENLNPINFYLNGQKFTLDGEGTFEMIFIDRNYVPYPDELAENEFIDDGKSDRPGLPFLQYNGDGYEIVFTAPKLKEQVIEDNVVINQIL